MKTNKFDLEDGDTLHFTLPDGLGSLRIELDTKNPQSILHLRCRVQPYDARIRLDSFNLKEIAFHVRMSP